MKRFLKLLALLTVATMLITCFAACGTENGDGEATDEPEKTEAPAEKTETPDGGEDKSPSESGDEESGLYPLDAEGVTLTYWTAGQASNLNLLDNGDLSNHKSWQQALQNLGLDVEVTIESQENSADKIGVMIASGEYFDIMAGFTNYYPGGGQAALDDEIVYNVLDYSDWCPDYMELINSDKDIRSRVLTDDGSAPCFYHLVDAQVGPGYGSYIRQDWLDELDLESPVTVQDWEDVLTAFKIEYDPKYPYLLDASGFNCGHAIVSAWDVAGSSFSQMNADNPWYQIDGTVYYGQNTDGLRQYLELMNKWYNDGLISHDFVSFNGFEVGDDLNAAASNDAGIWNGFETIDHRWDDLATDEDYAFTPITDPVLNEGDTLHLQGKTSMVDQPAAAILTTCENPELAVAFANYWYSYDGYLLANYGIEGEGLEFDAEGNPQCSELIMNPADGMTVSNAQFLYSVNFVNGLFDMNRAVAYQIGCRSVWGSNRDNAYDLPYNYISLTSDESTEFNTIMTDINTYASENIVKFITGEKSLSDWDAYVDQLSNMGIDRAVEIMQAAYSRYLQR